MRSYSLPSQSLKLRETVLWELVRIRIVGWGTCVSWVLFMTGIWWKWEISWSRADGTRMKSGAGFIQKADFLPSTVCTRSCRAGWLSGKDSMTWGWVTEAGAGRSVETIPLRNWPWEWCPVSKESSCQCHPLRFPLWGWTVAFMIGWGAVFLHKWACSKSLGLKSFPPHWESTASCKSPHLRWSARLQYSE